MDGGNPLLLPAVLYASGGFVVTGVAVADVNHDGIPDLVVTNECVASDDCYAGSVSVLLGNGDGTFQPAVSYPSNAYSTLAVAVADVNHDGKPDIILNSAAPFADVNADAVISVLLGNGDGTFQPATLYDAGGLGASGDLGGESVAVADLNGDGNPDIAVANYGSVPSGSGTVAILMGNGDGTFQPAVVYNSRFGHVAGLAVADVNGDGILDLVVATDTLVILLGKGDGTFYDGNGYGYQLSPPVVAPAVADVNGDGILDLLAASNGDWAISVLLGTGGGYFNLIRESFAVNEYGIGSLAVADLNGDGIPDLIAGTAGDVATLYGHGDGTFESAVGYYVDGTGWAAIVADLNHDGKPDVVATNWVVGGEDAVAVLLNNRQGPPYTSTATTLTLSADPAHRKQTIAYTAKITSQSAGAATGTVTFHQTDGTQFTQAFVASVVGNEATIGIYYPTKGNYTISAAYSGDAINSYSDSNQLREVISNVPISTSTRLSSSALYSIFGETVTFSATIRSTIGPLPDGATVTFFDGTSLIGMTTTAAGIATFVTSSLAPGKHTIIASYSGDASFRPSRAGIKQTVSVPPVTSTTEVATSGSPSQSGQPVTFTATITSRFGIIPSGELVTFYNDFHPIGTGTTAFGLATFTTSSLTVGTHNVKATYDGDSTFHSSTGKVTQVVE
jgi:hypothetical protein